MLRSFRDMEGYRIGATDGLLGRVRDFYFDDDAWVIRYLVVDSDAGPALRRVLISPISIGEPKWSEKILPVFLTRQQVADSPDIDTEKPVSRQQEMGYIGYYGYGQYWGGGGLWGAGLYPDVLQAGLYHVQSPDAKAGAGRQPAVEPHLRSGNVVTRYYVHASDGDIGHVGGFLVDDRSWVIRYLIVNTSNWWLGHEVLIATRWIEHVDWAESRVVVALSREAIRRSPAYDASVSLDRDQEAGIHAHYGRPGYWTQESGKAREGQAAPH